LKTSNLLSFLHREPNIVEPLHQASFSERIDVEADYAAIRSADFLIFEIDGERCVGAAFSVVHELFKVLRRDNDRQYAVLTAIIVENIGNVGGCDAGNPKMQKPPGCMLAARAAAEILTCYDDLCIPVGRLVEHEVRVLLATFSKAHIIE